MKTRNLSDCSLHQVCQCCLMCACLQVEADLGYPGGKAKIIHKESDIIMAFAINKVLFSLPLMEKHKAGTKPRFWTSSLMCVCVQANSNEIVLASTHDVQEVDVSSLVAVQPFTWIGEDFDKESRR